MKLNRPATDGIALACWLGSCTTAIVSAAESTQGNSLTWAVVAIVLGVNAILLYFIER